MIYLFIYKRSIIYNTELVYILMAYSHKRKSKDWRGRTQFFRYPNIDVCFLDSSKPSMLKIFSSMFWKYCPSLPTADRLLRAIDSANYLVFVKLDVRRKHVNIVRRMRRDLCYFAVNYGVVFVCGVFATLRVYELEGGSTTYFCNSERTGDRSSFLTVSFRMAPGYKGAFGYRRWSHQN